MTPEIPFAVAASSWDGSYDIPGGIYVIRDQPELEAFWSRLGKGKWPLPSPPSVAWPRCVALFVLLGARRSTGYRVQVERVIPDGTDVRVDAVELTPPPLALTGAAMTAPYQMITIPRFEGSAKLSITQKRDE